jgi:nitrite reductase/ring-hydroxylating ferredoxin subunit
MGEYVRIAGMGEVPPGSVLAVEITGRWVAICNVGGACFALKNFGSVESNLGRT